MAEEQRNELIHKGRVIRLIIEGGATAAMFRCKNDSEIALLSGFCADLIMAIEKEGTE